MISASNASPILIGRRYLNNQLQQSYWKNNSLANIAGFTQFTTGHICKGISLTQSQCKFKDDYHACLNYERNTILLVFGLRGVSTFYFKCNQRSTTAHLFLCNFKLWMIPVTRINYLGNFC